jgi:hypothetical protein
MKKTILFLGLAAMISATPAFAATKAYAPAPAPAKHAQAMCIVHGKKIPCAHHTVKHHAMHKAHKVHMASKKK